jgi:EAL domain-containing protein (putative c-di-GMP-specific phosphodiesterase class I)
VTRHACERLKRWRRQLKAELFMSINIAPRHLMQDDLLKFFTETVKEVGIPPSSLLLEITETGLMESLELVQDRLTEMAMHGFTFAIDDFGTGYSSLANLARLPVNKVKVDRAFLNGIPRDEEAVKLLSSILALSRSLELEVVVEGVESTEQIQFLRQFDNQLLFQGFFFDRPQPEEYWDGVFLKSRLPTYSLTEQQ